MIGHPFPDCPRVARFVAGHIYKMSLLYGILVVFLKKSNRFYRFKVLSSEGVKDKIHKRNWYIVKDAAIPHYHVKEVTPDNLPLYINWCYHTDLYKDLLSGHKKLAGTKCLTRLKDLNKMSSV